MSSLLSFRGSNNYINLRQCIIINLIVDEVDCFFLHPCCVFSILENVLSGSSLRTCFARDRNFGSLRPLDSVFRFACDIDLSIQIKLNLTVDSVLLVFLNKASRHIQGHHNVEVLVCTNGQAHHSEVFVQQILSVTASLITIIYKPRAKDVRRVDITERQVLSVATSNFAMKP